MGRGKMVGECIGGLYVEELVYMMIKGVWRRCTTTMLSARQIELHTRTFEKEKAWING